MACGMCGPQKRPPAQSGAAASPARQAPRPAHRPAPQPARSSPPVCHVSDPRAPHASPFEPACASSFSNRVGSLVGRPRGRPRAVRGWVAESGIAPRRRRCEGCCWAAPGRSERGRPFPLRPRGSPQHYAQQQAITPLGTDDLHSSIITARQLQGISSTLAGRTAWSGSLSL